MFGETLQTVAQDFFLCYGLNNTLRVFQEDISALKLRKNQVDCVIEDILSGIQSMDLEKILKVWTSFKSFVEFNIPSHEIELLHRYEKDIYRLYIVSCYQHGNRAKIGSFFQRMSSDLLNDSDWHKWIALIYDDKPDHPAYKKYFDNSWKELFVLSLHNFLSILTKNLSIKARDKLSSLISQNASLNMNNDGFEEILEDFSIIAPSISSQSDVQPSKSKSSFRAFFKNRLLSNQ
ncbi:unnamed protein product [Auanema sp. JU1783]|nr:unnamed protein product [Auanema sp. JU1783]